MLINMNINSNNYRYCLTTRHAAISSRHTLITNTSELAWLIWALCCALANCIAGLWPGLLSHSLALALVRPLFLSSALSLSLRHKQMLSLAIKKLLYQFHFALFCPVEAQQTAGSDRHGSIPLPPATPTAPGMCPPAPQLTHTRLIVCWKLQNKTFLFVNFSVGVNVVCHCGTKVARLLAHLPNTSPPVPATRSQTKPNRQ